MPWIPGDWLLIGPTRTETLPRPFTRKEKKVRRVLSLLFDVVFWVAVWYYHEKIEIWIVRGKSEKTAKAPDFRGLLAVTKQSHEISSPSTSSKASDENEESSDYSIIATPSKDRWLELAGT
jgi:hypothetical protein